MARAVVSQARGPGKAVPGEFFSRSLRLIILSGSAAGRQVAGPVAAHRTGRGQPRSNATLVINSNTRDLTAPRSPLQAGPGSGKSLAPLHCQRPCQLHQLRRIQTDYCTTQTAGVLPSLAKQARSGRRSSGLTSSRRRTSGVQWPSAAMNQRFPEKERPALRYFPGDLRDEQRPRRAFQGIEYVVHAAALKQVPAAEHMPLEVIKTHVVGAQNVIESALDAEPNASRPRQPARPRPRSTSTTRPSCARTTHSSRPRAPSVRRPRDVRFRAVRSGNVMGSRGAALPLSRERHKTGARPITDPQMTRFSISLQQGPCSRASASCSGH